MDKQRLLLPSELAGPTEKELFVRRVLRRRTGENRVNDGVNQFLTVPAGVLQYTSMEKRPLLAEFLVASCYFVCNHQKGAHCPTA